MPPRRALPAAALVLFATAAFGAGEGISLKVAYLLESPELQAAEKRLPIQGGDWGWHFEGARVDGVEGHSDADLDYTRVSITVTYGHNFSRGATCEIKATVETTVLSRQPAEPKKTVRLACDCISSARGPAPARVCP
jgi:hypothetical protein